MTSNQPNTPSNKSSERKLLEVCSMSIYTATGEKLEKLSEQINSGGRKRVQWKDIVDMAISKITMDDLKKLKEEKLTASDRIEEMFKKFKAANPGADRDTFLSELLKSVDPKTINGLQGNALREVKNA